MAWFLVKHREEVVVITVMKLGVARKEVMCYTKLSHETFLECGLFDHVKEESLLLNRTKPQNKATERHSFT
jgi:hypothetical protein